MLARLPTRLRAVLRLLLLVRPEVRPARLWLVPVRRPGVWAVLHRSPGDLRTLVRLRPLSTMRVRVRISHSSRHRQRSRTMTFLRLRRQVLRPALLLLRPRLSQPRQWE